VNVPTPLAESLASPWVILGPLLACIAAGFCYLIYRLLSVRVSWRQLSQSWPNARYAGKNGYEPDRVLLALALSKTVELLAMHTKWPREQVRAALDDVHVYVHVAYDWVDAWGRRVAGLSEGRYVQVGRDLAALLHECAHRCEEVIDKERDDAHATWVADGIREAESAFALWLSAQRLAAGPRA
jgi:hypothetical protein